MGDNLGELPKFPTEESKQYEEALAHPDDPTESFFARVRHAWPVYLLLVCLAVVWALAVFVLAFSSRPGSAALIAVVFLPVAIALRWFWYKQIGGRQSGSSRA
jgi:hypothetical protein